MIIKQKIKEAGLTYKQIAELLGVSETNIKVLVGKDDVSTRTLKRLASVLNCRVGDFFKDDMTPEPHDTLKCPHCGKPIEVVLK